jgi:hypothetical protein
VTFTANTSAAHTRGAQDVYPAVYPQRPGPRKMASPRGFEPPTSGLGNRCSIQLSYGDVAADIAFDAYGVCFFSRSVERARRTSHSAVNRVRDFCQGLCSLFLQLAPHGFECRSGPPKTRAPVTNGGIARLPTRRMPGSDGAGVCSAPSRNAVKADTNRGARPIRFSRSPPVRRIARINHAREGTRSRGTARWTCHS